MAVPAASHPAREFADLTWREVQSLDRARTVAILPVGAIEAHGPHLPLGTDTIIASGMARAGAERLRAAGWSALVLPALPFTAAPFAAGFAGTLSVGAATVTALVLDLARELTRHGFAALALANAHLDPAHRAALAAAVEGARAGHLLPVIHPDLARRRWAQRLGEEFGTGACHAGRFEGSVVMALAPATVRDEVRRALPPNPASLSVAIAEGRTSFEAAGGPDAYFGWPAEASVEEGHETVAALAAILAEAVDEALRGGTNP